MKKNSRECLNNGEFAGGGGPTTWGYTRANSSRKKEEISETTRKTKLYNKGNMNNNIYIISKNNIYIMVLINTLF